MTRPAAKPGTADLLRLLFEDHRSNTRFGPEAVPPSLIEDVFEAIKWGPTSRNTVPLRLVVLASDAARATVIEHAKPANRPKLERAPLILVVARDDRFHDHCERLSPTGSAAKAEFEADPAFRSKKAHDNTLLQAGYLIVGLRAAGLAVRPYGGFDKEATDGALLGGTSWRSELLLAVGFPAEGDHGAGSRQGRVGWADAALVL